MKKEKQTSGALEEKLVKMWSESQREISSRWFCFSCLIEIEELIEGKARWPGNWKTSEKICNPKF